MIPIMRTKLFRASACQSDLRHNGIDLDRLGRGETREFIRENLDYFQAMLGYDAREREVYSLIRRTGDGNPGRHIRPTNGKRPGHHPPPVTASARHRQRT